MKSAAIFAFLVFLLPQVFAQEQIPVKTSILDETGNAAKNVNPKDTLQIHFEFEIKKEFVYIVQVQDLAGFTVFLESNTVLVTNNQTADIHWKPDRENSYKIQTFLWTSLDAPSPLSVVQEITVNVCSGKAGCFADTIKKIVDGDTLDIGKDRIRLALVNTPERGDEGYSEATNFTSIICPVGSSALVDEDDGQTSGSYGRIVGKVYCQDKMLNAELLQAKHATVYEQYCSVSEFSNEMWIDRYCA